MLSTTSETDIKVIIKGAGGHGIVVADIIWQMHRRHGNIIPIGFLDDDPALAGERHLGLNVLGACLSDVKGDYDALIVAIGDNRARMEIFEIFKQKRLNFATAIHPAAVIADSAVIETGTMVCAGAVVNPLAKIGANVILNTGCTIDHHNHIEDHVHIAPGVHLGGNVHIGKAALVGIGSTVLPGCSVGAWSIVGAGSVVTKDVPDDSVYCGIPAIRMDANEF